MKKRGLGPEDKIHKNFAALVRQYEGYGKLKCDYWSYDASGEKRTAMTASLLKSKGLRSGKSDYLFIKNKVCGRRSNNEPLFETHYLWLEMKKPKTGRIDFSKSNTPKIWSPAGKQSEDQKKFGDIFSNSTNSRYALVYSVEEAINILIEEGILPK